MLRLSAVPPQAPPAIPWQRPNATEAFAAEQLAGAQGYLAYPWASWIDLARDRPPPPAPFATTATAEPLALPPRPDALLESRREWHFEQQVYREQVHGQSADAARHTALAAEASSYAETLQQSVFALCPSGSGPNSIRLWEALGYGAIPVILANTLALPGDPALWRQATLRVPETAEAVAALPAQLAALRQQPERLVAMQTAGQQLWQRYGLPDGVVDVRGFLHDPDAALLAAAQHRLAANSAEAPLSLQASQPTQLPLQLNRQLSGSASTTPVLLQILDAAAPGSSSWCQIPFNA